jgi:hypothetical protein
MTLPPSRLRRDAVQYVVDEDYLDECAQWQQAAWDASLRSVEANLRLERMLDDGYVIPPTSRYVYDRQKRMVRTRRRKTA